MCCIISYYQYWHVFAQLGMFEARQIAELPADTMASLGIDPGHVSVIITAARDALMLADGGWLAESEDV